MQNFRQLHIEALQVPYAQNLAKQTCSQARQEWKAAAPLLQALGELGCPLVWDCTHVSHKSSHVPLLAFIQQLGLMPMSVLWLPVTRRLTDVRKMFAARAPKPGAGHDLAGSPALVFANHVH